MANALVQEWQEVRNNYRKWSLECHKHSNTDIAFTRCSCEYSLVFLQDAELSRVSVKDVPPVPLTMVYYQIEISVQSPQQMVTFDDSGQNNCWGFHPGSTSPNVSGLRELQ